MRVALSYHSLLLFASTCMAACLPKGAESAEARIEALEDSVTILTEALRPSVDLKPGDGSFSVVRLDVGSLAVSLDSVGPYGAGSLLTLSAANLASAEITGLVGTLGWGIPEADGTHAVDERRTRPLALSQGLPPGTWTRVTVTLDSVPPDQIRFIRLSEMSATGLKLP